MFNNYDNNKNYDYNNNYDNNVNQGGHSNFQGGNMGHNNNMHNNNNMMYQSGTGIENNNNNQNNNMMVGGGHGHTGGTNFVGNPGATNYSEAPGDVNHKKRYIGRLKKSQKTEIKEPEPHERNDAETLTEKYIKNSLLLGKQDLYNPLNPDPMKSLFFRLHVSGVIESANVILKYNI
jgi:hypothetical protein